MTFGVIFPISISLLPTIVRFLRFLFRQRHAFYRTLRTENIGNAESLTPQFVMRSAEMYLIAAEALAREGRLEEAVKPLNTLRNARGLADYDLAGKTQERLVDDILLERRRELWGEGFGITDILRTNVR